MRPIRGRAIFGDDQSTSLPVFSRLISMQSADICVGGSVVKMPTNQSFYCRIEDPSSYLPLPFLLRPQPARPLKFQVLAISPQIRFYHGRHLFSF